MTEVPAPEGTGEKRAVENRAHEKPPHERPTHDDSWGAWWDELAKETLRPLIEFAAHAASVAVASYICYLFNGFIHGLEPRLSTKVANYVSILDLITWAEVFIVGTWFIRTSWPFITKLFTGR